MKLFLLGLVPCGNSNIDDPKVEDAAKDPSPVPIAKSKLEDPCPALRPMEGEAIPL